jgi:hypothetical protein
MKKCSTSLVIKRNANQNSTDFISTQLEWPYSRAITTTNAGEDVVKQEPYTLLVGMQISTTNMESSMEIPQKAKGRTTI